MPDTRRSRPDTGAALRTHARRLFARHGYEGVSMRDIAGALGIRQSAIYNHFPSKQHLLLDLMVSHMAIMPEIFPSCSQTTGMPVCAFSQIGSSPGMWWGNR